MLAVLCPLHVVPVASLVLPLYVVLLFYLRVSAYHVSRIARSHHLAAISHQSLTLRDSYHLLRYLLTYKINLYVYFSILPSAPPVDILTSTTYQSLSCLCAYIYDIEYIGFRLILVLAFVLVLAQTTLACILARGGRGGQCDHTVCLSLLCKYRVINHTLQPPPLHCMIT